MKFRKKPIVIEAVQWDGSADSWKAVHELCVDLEHVVFLNRDHSLDIPTLEGRMTGSKGDWIIKGVKGELYPCKPDIFEATYEKVEE